MAVSQRTRIWALHASGVPMSGICAVTRLSLTHVRAAIVGVWFDDKMAAHHGR